MQSQADGRVSWQPPTAPFNGLSVIVEAPLTHCLEKGALMRGTAGGVFNAILRSAEIDRAQISLHSVFDTQLLNDDAAQTRKALGAEWPAFLKRNVERLAEEIRMVGPTVIVPMGASAALVTAGNNSIATMRGAPILGMGPFERNKLVPTLDVPNVMKQWKMYAVVIGDFVKAMREVNKGPELRYPKVDLIIRPSLKEVNAYLQGCLNADIISTDIETGWGMIRGISFSYAPEHAIYIPFIDLSHPTKSYWQDAKTEAQVWRAVKGVLECPIPKLGQNFDGYDIHWLLQKMGIRVRNVSHDLRLLHHAIYAELPKSLAFMASAYSALPGWKHWADHGGAKKHRAGKRDE